MKMNLPNKLTVIRALMVPFFVFFLLTGFKAEAAWFPGGVLPWGRIVALLIFCVASYTDRLDGKIARRDHLVTNFGKFMDPLADKLLVSSAFICFVQLGLLPAWICIILIAREFIISGIRLIAAEKGRVMAASNWGKAKTVFQIILIIALLIHHENVVIYHYFELVLLAIATFLSLFSLVEYIIKNKDVLKEE